MTVKERRFRSQGFTDRNKPHPPGKYEVEVLAHFNGAWQSREILNATGQGGSKLRGKLFTLEDPELIDSNKRLRQIRILLFPPIDNSAALSAIRLVRNAVLTIDGSRSAENVGAVVDSYMAIRELKPGGWRAERIGAGTYTVIFDFINGKDGPDRALWSADLNNRTVRPLNKNGKYFSWMPSH